MTYLHSFGPRHPCSSLFASVTAPLKQIKKKKKKIQKGWLAIAKLKPLSLFISLLSIPKKAFDNVKIEK